MYIEMFEFSFDSLLAKLICLVLAIIAAHYNIVFGVIIILIFISLNQNIIESMDGSMKNTSKDSNKEEFKKKHCENGKLMKDQKNITPDQVKNSFPNIKFSGDTCNPCDEDCQFEIISSEEQLTTLENLTPIDSNQISVDREEAIKKK